MVSVSLIGCRSFLVGPFPCDNSQSTYLGDSMYLPI
nr:MAG TPA: hypothetical protein [Caudoviricetes sp.]